MPSLCSSPSWRVPSRRMAATSPVGSGEAHAARGLLPARGLLGVAAGAPCPMVGTAQAGEAKEGWRLPGVVSARESPPLGLLDGSWRKAKPSSSSKAPTGWERRPREGSRGCCGDVEPQPVPTHQPRCWLPVRLPDPPCQQLCRASRSGTEREAPRSPIEREQEGKVHRRSEVCAHFCQRNQPPMGEPAVGKAPEGVGEISPGCDGAGSGCSELGPLGSAALRPAPGPPRAPQPSPHGARGAP